MKKIDSLPKPFTDCPDELISMDHRNPFRDKDDNHEREEDNVKAATVIVFMLKSSLVAMLTAAKGSPTKK